MNRILKFSRKIKFSTSAFELGPSIRTESLIKEEAQFFRLEQISGLEAALNAPEGSVVIKPLSRLSHYDSGII